MKLGGFALAPTLLAFYQRGQWSGDDPIACEAAGGRVQAFFFNYDRDGQGVPPVNFKCIMPSYVQAPASAPAPVTVTSTVQTTASPQISPVLVQQDEPKNSPVQAGTQQTSPSPQSSGGTSQNLLDYLKARDEEAAAREAKLLDLAAGSGGGGVYVPPPPVTYDEGSGSVPGSVPATSAPVLTGMNPLLILALLGTAAYAAAKGNERGNKSGARRRSQNHRRK